MAHCACGLMRPTRRPVLLFTDIALTALIAAAVFIRGVWPLEPAAGILTQLALLALALATVSLFLAQPFGAAIALAGVGLTLWRTRAAFAPASPAVAGAEAKIIWANLFRQRRSLEDLQRLALKERADVVALGEFPVEAKLLPAFAQTYPHQYPHAPTRRQDIVVFSRIPFTDAKTVFSTWRRPSLVVTVEIAGEALTIAATHAPVPWTPQRLATQRKHIAETFAAVETRKPFVVVGDFNAAPWSNALDNDRKTTRLHLGPKATWVFPLAVLGIPIDHGYVSSGLEGSVALGPFIGSDHFPIIVSVKRKAER